MNRLLRAFPKGFDTKNILAVGEAVALGFMQFASYMLLVRVTDVETVAIWLFINALLTIARAADLWSQGLVSFVAQQRGTGDNAKAHNYVTTALAAGALGYAVVACLGYLVLSLVIGHLLEPQQVKAAETVLPLFGLVFFTSSLSGLYQLGLLGHERIDFKVAQTVGGALLLLPGIWFLVPPFGLSGILYAQFLQALFMLAFAIAAYHGVVAKGVKATWWQPALFREMISYGFKAMAVGWVQLIIEPVIRLLANHFGGLVGVFQVELASRFILLARSLTISVGQLLVPRYARITQDPSYDLGKALKNDIFAFTVFGGMLICSVVAVSGIIVKFFPGLDAVLFPALTVILSIGWLSNTIFAPGYFLLVSRRMVRSLFVVHFWLTAGAAILGWVGGWAFGLLGAMAGVSLALLMSTRQLTIELKKIEGLKLSGDDTVLSDMSVFLIVTTPLICLILLYLQTRVYAGGLMWWVIPCISVCTACASAFHLLTTETKTFLSTKTSRDT